MNSGRPWKNSLPRQSENGKGKVWFVYFDLTVVVRVSSSLSRSSFCFMMILFCSVSIRRALAISDRDGLSHLNSVSLEASACFPLIMEPRRFSSLSSSAKATRCFFSNLSEMLWAACSRLTSGKQSSQYRDPLSSSNGSMTLRVFPHLEQNSANVPFQLSPRLHLQRLLRILSPTVVGHSFSVSRDLRAASRCSR